jgi:hypothetical protein
MQKMMAVVLRGTVRAKEKAGLTGETFRLMRCGLNCKYL